MQNRLGVAEGYGGMEMREGIRRGSKSGEESRGGDTAKSPACALHGAVTT